MSEAEFVNNPLISCDKEIKNDLVTIEKENVVLETLKMAEDKNSFIFRFREVLSIESECKILFNKDLLDINSIQFVNLVEEEVNDNYLFSPFELKTIKINKKNVTN